LNKLLSGEQPLGKAFWLFGVVGSLVWLVIYGLVRALVFVGAAVFVFIGDMSNSPQDVNTPMIAVSRSSIAVITGAALYLAIVCVGIWRSAGRDTESLLMAYIARLAVLAYFAGAVTAILIAAYKWEVTR
jgi:hypothetical protein